MGEEDEDPDWLTAFQVPSRLRFGVPRLNLGVAAAGGKRNFFLLEGIAFSFCAPQLLVKCEILAN
jgi:hypothetical protein